MHILYSDAKVFRFSNDTESLKIIKLRLELRQTLAVVLGKVTFPLRGLNGTNVYCSLDLTHRRPQDL